MWSADFLARACGAQLTGSHTTFSSVSIDTRTIQPGALYVALRGENFDGHRFVGDALKSGATGVLVSQSVAVPADTIVLRVPDTLLALQQMGSLARDQFQGPVVAVTGSNGKTSTRQLIASILSAHQGDAAILSTQGNYNNHIGVPLTLLRLTPEHRVVVVEAGMNHFRELSLLSALAHPTIAVITNAGPAHLEGVGSLAGVAKAKAEVFDGMSGAGVAVLNADDYFLPYWEVINRERECVRFGFGDQADIRGDFDASTSTLRITKGLGTPLSVILPFSGEHNGRNALAAVAVARSLAIPVAAIKTGLESATNIGGRLTRRQLTNTLEIIDDSYNANPASVQAGLKVLLNAPHRTIIVLGDMAELGSNSDELHHELLGDIERSAVDHVFTLGTRMRRAVDRQGGRAQSFIEIDQLVPAIKSVLNEPSTVLVKGAHSMAMHRVIDKLAALYGEQK